MNENEKEFFEKFRELLNDYKVEIEILNDGSRSTSSSIDFNFGNPWNFIHFPHSYIDADSIQNFIDENK